MKIDLDTSSVKPINGRAEKVPASSSLGQTMLVLRESACMTQEEVGQVIGAPRTTVTKYETGKTRVDLDQLTKLASYLGLEVVITIKKKQ